MKGKEFDREEDLRKQHKEFIRSHDSEHNRHPGNNILTLGKRRSRRRWRLILQNTILTWNQAHSKKAV